VWFCEGLCGTVLVFSAFYMGWAVRNEIAFGEENAGDVDPDKSTAPSNRSTTAWWQDCPRDKMWPRLQESPMKVIERDPDGSPKIILATREEMQKAGYSISGYDVGELLGEFDGVLGIALYEKLNPAVYEKHKPSKYTRGSKPT